MDGKVIFKGTTKKGNEIIVRYPGGTDAQAMCDYINELSQEQTFIRYQGEQISLEEEKKYLDDVLEKIKKNQAVHLLIFCKEKLIGISEVDMKDKIESHVGFLGISLLKKFRGEGIGNILMKLILEITEKELPQLKLITLSVFSENYIAKEIYRKFGFTEYGRLPEGILYKGQYTDHIYMYKKIK